jgi:hypothetical protein
VTDKELIERYKSHVEGVKARHAGWQSIVLRITTEDLARLCELAEKESPRAPQVINEK